MSVAAPLSVDTTLTTTVSASESPNRSDLIEKIFERVEAESARRAEVEAVEGSRGEGGGGGDGFGVGGSAGRGDDVDVDAAEASRLLSEADDTMPSPVSPNATISASAAVKQRRRGSVSVSRFGMPTDLNPEPASIGNSLSPSTRPSRSSSIVIQNPPQMYNVQPTAHHGSADSLASESEDPSLQVEDHGHSTTMATISGKQSISKAISQRLSRTRTRSRDVLTATRGNGNVVIGIAVQEATIEHHAEEIETPHETVVKSTVEVPQGVKRQRSAPKLDGNGNGNGSSAGGQLNWMSKAKELTTRFKRRSMAALSQIS